MKRNLFWVLYYGITISINVIAGFVFRPYWNFNWFSAWPALYIIISALGAHWNKPSMRETRITFEQRLAAKVYIQYDKQLGFLTADGTDEKIQHFMERDEHKAAVNFSCKGFLIITPLFLPFILFFHNVIKILTCSMWIIVAIGALACSFCTTNERIRQHEKERREQEQREQWGRWK